VQHDAMYDNMNLPRENNEVPMPNITLLRAQEYWADKFLVACENAVAFPVQLIGPDDSLIFYASFHSTEITFGSWIRARGRFKRHPCADRMLLF
jgi:hypothetical protein